MKSNHFTDSVRESPRIHAYFTRIHFHNFYFKLYLFDTPNNSKIFFTATELHLLLPICNIITRLIINCMNGIYVDTDLQILSKAFQSIALISYLLMDNPILINDDTDQFKFTNFFRSYFYKGTRHLPIFITHVVLK